MPWETGSTRQPAPCSSAATCSCSCSAASRARGLTGAQLSVSSSTATQAVAAGAQPGQLLGLLEVERAEDGDEHAADAAAAQPLDRAVEVVRRAPVPHVGQRLEQQRPR